MKIRAINLPCEKEVVRLNKLNNASLTNANIEIPKMIEQSKKEYDDKNKTRW